jgi:hypothetical protein
VRVRPLLNRPVASQPYMAWLGLPIAPVDLSEYPPPTDAENLRICCSQREAINARGRRFARTKQRPVRQPRDCPAPISGAWLLARRDSAIDPVATGNRVLGGRSWLAGCDCLFQGSQAAGDVLAPVPLDPVPDRRRERTP